MNPPTVIFRKVGKKSKKKSNFFFILSTDSKYYLFGKKNDIFLGFVLVFLRVTLLKAIVLSRFLGK